MQLTNRVLKKRARPVKFSSPVRNESLANEMLDIMHKEHGIGLAATQIGRSLRLFVMEIAGVPYKCFNPEIIESSQNLVEFREGCLSFKGDQCIIKRPNEISVQYQDSQGRWYRGRLDGLAARCFQHELDHLDGITMWDRHKEQNAEQP